MAIISNNTELSLATIGSGSALSCHTDLTTCCRDQDNTNGEALGVWIGPNGNSVSETSDEGFYVTREMGSVSMNLVEGSSDAAGSYCCQVPRSSGVTSTHCIIVTGEGWCNIHCITDLHRPSFTIVASSGSIGPVVGAVIGVIVAVLLVVLVIVLVLLFLR